MAKLDARSRGFTLIELLIVIAIIAIIAGVVFALLDPLTRFKDSRDSHRWQDVAALANAIKLNQVDNGGKYLTAIRNLTAGIVYMIGTATSSCNAHNGTCEVAIASTSYCVNLAGLVTGGEIGAVPISPIGSGSTTWDATRTGYTLKRDSTNSITVQACENEHSATSIKITR